MRRHRRIQGSSWRWCFRCGHAFRAVRDDATCCGPRCRQQVCRLFKAGVMPALIYPFREAPHPAYWHERLAD